MKRQTGIWIDSSKAIIVAFDEGREHITEIASNIENRVHHKNEGDQGTFMGERHINNEKKFDERKKHQFSAFLKTVLDKSKNADELYVFGPAEAKLKLKQLIDDEKKAARLKSVEAADNMTVNQVVAKIKQFYNLE